MGDRILRNRYRVPSEFWDYEPDLNREDLEDRELKGFYDPEVDWEMEGHCSSPVEEFINGPEEW